MLQQQHDSGKAHAAMQRAAVSSAGCNQHCARDIAAETKRWELVLGSRASFASELCGHRGNHATSSSAAASRWAARDAPVERIAHSAERRAQRG